MAQGPQCQPIGEDFSIQEGSQTTERTWCKALASGETNSACNATARVNAGESDPDKDVAEGNSAIMAFLDLSTAATAEEANQDAADEIVSAFMHALEGPMLPFFVEDMCQDNSEDGNLDDTKALLLTQNGVEPCHEADIEQDEEFDDALAALTAAIFAAPNVAAPATDTKFDGPAHEADEVDIGEQALHLSKAHGVAGAYTPAVAATFRAPRVSTSQEVCDLLYNGQQTVSFADEDDKEEIQSNGIFAAIQLAHYDGLNEINLSFQENILSCNTLPFHAIITLFTEAYLMIASDILVSTTCLFVADGMRLAKMFNSTYSCHERKGGISDVLHSRHSKFSHRSLIHMKPRWKMKTSKIEDSIYHFLIDPG